MKRLKVGLNSLSAPWIFETSFAGTSKLPDTGTVVESGEPLGLLGRDERVLKMLRWEEEPVDMACFLFAKKDFAFTPAGRLDGWGIVDCCITSSPLVEGALALFRFSDGTIESSDTPNGPKRATEPRGGELHESDKFLRDIGACSNHKQYFFSGFEFVPRFRKTDQLSGVI